MNTLDQYNNKDVTIHTPDHSVDEIDLCDLIEKHFTEEEELITECLGRLFYHRSLNIWDKRDHLDLDPYANNPSCVDKSRMGADFYKFLAYPLVVKCKQTIGGNKNFEHGNHSLKELLVILFGNEVKDIIKNPRQWLIGNGVND